MEPARTIIGRYNPHRLARLYQLVHSSGVSTSSFKDILIQRSFQFWREMHDPEGFEWAFPGMDSSLREEYGLDACSLAVLTGRDESCTIRLLESAWLWLAEIHDHFSGIRSSKRPLQSAPEVWLRTSIVVSEMVLERRRPELAIPLLRKAWNQSPLAPASPRICRVIFASLLEPFAPILGWGLRQFLNQHVSRLEDDRRLLEDEFKALKVIRLKIDRGAQHVVVVQRQEWEANPLATLSRTENWAARLLSETGWAIVCQGESWLLYRPSSLLKSASSV